MTESGKTSNRWTVGEPTTPVAMRVFANLYVAVFGRKAFYGWNRRLLNLAVRGMGIGNPSVEMVEAGEDRLIRSLRPLGAVDIFDIGAHVGEFAVRIQAGCPEARIWSFEPHPKSYRQLATTVAGTGVTAVNLALSDVPGQAMLYDYDDGTAEDGSVHASLHQEVFAEIHHGHASGFEVQMTTVDAFMAAHDIERIAMLKVDAEGHELAILRGARHAIERKAVDIVQFEFNEMNVMSRVFFRDFYDALPDFTFYRMASNGLAPMGPYQPRTHELFILQNIVAIRDGFDHLSSLV